MPPTEVKLKIHPNSLPESRQHLKIADIEVLRGISIIFVLMSHIPGILVIRPVPLLTHIQAHYLQFYGGVDIFLAISGFVIGRSILPKLALAATPRAFTEQAILFWVRRAWRLLPSAWLWLVLILLLASFFNKSGAYGLFHDNFEAAVAAFLSVANIRLAHVFMTAGAGASPHYWSLSLEEQFYLFLPPAAFLLRRRLLVVLAAVCFVLPFCLSDAYVGVFRVQPLLFGVMLAELSRSSSYLIMEPTFLSGSAFARALALAIPLAALAALSPLSQDIAPYGRFFLIAVLSAVLVFVASYDRDYTMGDGTLKTILLWFGSRSYALYLIHVPVFLATREIDFRLSAPGQAVDAYPTWLFLIIGFGLSLCLAELNYRLVETPLRNKGILITRRMAARFASLNEGDLPQRSPRHGLP